MDATAALTFTKFGILPSELRSHIISYNDYKTIKNYAPCSKLCNLDIQQYNTRPPCHIPFHYHETFAMVELTYKRANQWEFKYFLYFVNQQMEWWRNVESVIKVCEPYGAAVEYVKDRFKYVKTGECAFLVYYGNVYLPELSTITKIQKFDWLVYFHQSMYPKFYDSVKNVKNERLKLRLVPGIKQVYNIPVEFFQTEFFHNLAHFECEFDLPGLQENDLLAMKATKITIKCSTISDRAINRKIQQWISNPTYQPVDHKFLRSNTGFDKSVILENLSITATNQVISKNQRPTGIYALFHDSGSIIRFRTFEAYKF